jgi:hypothetical protein
MNNTSLFASTGNKINNNQVTTASTQANSSVKKNNLEKPISPSKAKPIGPLV